MVYKNCFVAEVKCNGKILRVIDEAVNLPFGSNYSLLLKNLNSKRVSVKISIDGEDVLDGSTLIISANSEMELEGFLKNTVAKNKFKFIQKTKEIQEYRGDKIDDGFIRIEFAYEKQHSVSFMSGWVTYKQYEPIVYYDYASEKHYFPKIENSANYVRSCSFNSLSDGSTAKQDEGITVKGEEINQQFQNTYVGNLEPAEVLIIKLRGYKPTGEKIEKPITVKTKITCKTCGKKSRSNVKYCSNCGTFLEI